MIIVVADDFTGAAEVAGIAHRHGLHAVLTMSAADVPSAEVWVIATDMRSMPLAGALAWVRRFARQFADVAGDSIFFKIDSVLRGYPFEALSEYRESARRQWVMMVPANPTLGRVIRDGVYYVDGVPITESSFATPGVEGRGSSHILDLVPSGLQARVQVADPIGQIDHNRPIVVGNAWKAGDLKAWAMRLGRDTIAAGGAGFFDAILSLRGTTRVDSPALDRSGVLMMVCGSSHTNSRAAVDEARRLGMPIACMPREWLSDHRKTEAGLAVWIDEAVGYLTTDGRVLVTIGGDVVEARQDTIRSVTATAVETVLKRIQVDDLLLEGGATAAAVLERLEYKHYHPVKAWTDGVVTLVTEGADFRVTTKPGSYRWPDELWGKWILENR